MRKLTILLFLFSLYLYSDDYKISLGDQLLGINLYNTIDNARTFSFNSNSPLIYGINLELIYSLLTDNLYTSRVDELALLLNYKSLYIKNINIIPKLGIMVSGNLEGKSIENTLQRIAGNSNGYSEEEKIDQFLYMGLEFNKENDLLKPIGKRIKFLYKINSFADLISNYRLSLNIGSYLMARGDNLEFSAGYNYVYFYSITDSNTVQYIANVEDEGRLKFLIRAGGFQYELKLFLNGNFATGDYSFIIGGIPVGKDLSQIDIKVIPGIEFNFESYTVDRSLEIGFIPMEWELSRLELGLKTIYGYNSSSIYYNTILGVIKANLFENSNLFWISPFIAFNIGIENRHQSSSENNNSSDLKLALEGELGVRLLLPQLLVKDNIQYGFNICYLTPNKVNLSFLIAVEL